MKKFVSNNPEESRKFAGDLAKEILAGNPMSRRNFDIDTGALVLALYGDLGSGKTTFAQAFAEALGVKEKIKSPTFIIFRKSKIPASSAGGENKEWREKGFEKFLDDLYMLVLDTGWFGVRNTGSVKYPVLIFTNFPL